MSYINDFHRYFYHWIYRKTHSEEFKAYGRKYYHKPENLEKARLYRISHPFKMKDNWKIAKKRWHENNKLRRYAEYKIYRKKNIMRMRARDQRRLARENNSKGLITVELIQKVYESNIKKYGTLTCYLCLNPVPFKKDHLEHKTPLSRGGTNYFRNLDVACQSCNISKRNKTLKEYRKYALLISTK